MGVIERGPLQVAAITIHLLGRFAGDNLKTTLQPSTSDGGLKQRRTDR
jgi:hypothetical protein